mmetsp:Transcript_9677/g.30110  ORF Transcript_9677/g.30110 Transcript_9677/m.30110 type:complete len:309 (+) Transcript_9677:570-1496(+)
MALCGARGEAGGVTAGRQADLLPLPLPGRSGTGVEVAVGSRLNSDAEADSSAAMWKVPMPTLSSSECSAPQAVEGSLAAGCSEEPWPTPSSEARSSPSSDAGSSGRPGRHGAPGPGQALAAAAGLSGGEGSSVAALCDAPSSSSSSGIGSGAASSPSSSAVGSRAWDVGARGFLRFFFFESPVLALTRVSLTIQASKGTESPDSESTSDWSRPCAPALDSSTSQAGSVPMAQSACSTSFTSCCSMAAMEAGSEAQSSFHRGLGSRARPFLSERKSGSTATSSLKILSPSRRKGFMAITGMLAGSTRTT